MVLSGLQQTPARKSGGPESRAKDRKWPRPTGFLTIRNTWEFLGDEIHWSSDSSENSEPFTTWGKGTFVRMGAEGRSAFPASHRVRSDNAPPEMARFAPFLGRFQVTGFMADEASDRGRRAFTGKQSIEAVLGGQAVRNHWRSDSTESHPGAEGYVYYVWNSGTGTFDSLHLNSRGGFRADTVTIDEGGALCEFHRTVQEGEVSVGRSTRTRQEDGTFQAHNKVIPQSGVPYERWSLTARPIQ